MENHVGEPFGILSMTTTHIPHPKLSQREITERKNQSEHKNKHKERKKAFEKQ
jgi:hypothetical protein